MLKNKLLLLIFISYNCYSQQFGEIIYSKEIKYKSTKSYAIHNMNNIMADVSEFSKKLKYKLLFTNKESIFSLMETLELDTDFNYFAIANLGSKGIFYTNKSNILLHKKEFAGDLYLINDDITNITWNLTTETKKIGKFNCYKAIYENRIKSDNNERNEKIIAWYAPTINSNFGPIGYGNLPGMILELELVKFKGTNELKIIFTANKIKFNKEIDIKKPTKGIKITKLEFNKLLKNAFKNK